MKKITKTYDNLLSQKDSIIDKQDKTIEEMIESAKQMAKDNKATITSSVYHSSVALYNPRLKTIRLQ